MEEYKLPINFISNLILSFSFALFMIFVFGRVNSKIYELPWYKTFLLRVGISMCACGALLNIFTFSNPPWSEVILNAGLAFIFGWATWFHYKTFVIPYTKEIQEFDACEYDDIPPVKKKIKRTKKSSAYK